MHLIKMDGNKDVNLNTMSFERFSIWAVYYLKKYLQNRQKEDTGI